MPDERDNTYIIKGDSPIYQNNPDETIKRSIDKLIIEKQNITNRIKSAEKRANVLKIGNINAISAKLKKTLINSEKEEIRNYIKSSIEEIVASENEVTIKLKID